MYQQFWKELVKIQSKLYDQTMFLFSNRNKLEYEIIEFDQYKCIRFLQPDWDVRFLKIMKRFDAHILSMVPGQVVTDHSVPGGQRIQPIGWNDTEFSFLDDIPSKDLEGLEFAINKTVQLSRLARFPEIKYLSIPKKFKGLPNLRQFKKLEVLDIGYKKSMESAFECSWLKHLQLSSYPFKDLTPLSHMRDLEFLQISGRKIETLKGIGAMSALKEIEILHATTLKHVHDLGDQSNVQKATLFRCGKVEGIEKFTEIIDTCEGMN